MKVYVTQGHEKGIGLEVFFKSCLMMGERNLSLLRLLAYKSAVSDTLDELKLPYTIHTDSIDLCGSIIEVDWLESISVSQSFTALELGMRLAESGGILFTLPTSKDQFPPGNPGHTEFFRAFYKRSDLGMFFSSPRLQVLLLSDHVALKDISTVLTKKVITERLKTALNTLKAWKWPTEKILIAGLNPHAGEGGRIGDEDLRVTEAVKQLNDTHNFELSGPYPGDTMLFEQKSPRDLLVYLYHDQGLGVFKGLQGFIGSNITLGLPYPRFSPDHGTSFGLFGKNKADYRGCSYSLNQALTMLARISHESYSGHKSKST